MSDIRRMPPPWTVTELAECFKVCDAENKALAYVYFRRANIENHTVMWDRLTKEEARRVAANIVKLPDLLKQTPESS